MEFENVTFGNERTSTTKWVVVGTVCYNKKSGWYYDSFEDIAKDYTVFDKDFVHFMIDSIEIYPV